MSKKFLFNRSVFSNAKGHDVKRKSSKGLVTGIALAGAIVLLGGSQIASADNVTASENNTTTSSTAADTDTANSQTVDSTDSDNSQVTSETVSSENSTASSEAASESNEAETNNDATASESADQSDDELSDETTSNEAQVKSQSVNALESAKYDKDDDEEEEEVNDIKFDNTGVKTTSSGVNIDGKNITITSAGTYTLTGSASGYSISVADKVTDTVKLKLDAVNLTDSTLYSSRDLDIKVLSDSSISSSLKNTIETGGALYISSKKKSGLKVTSTAGHAIKANSLEADKVTLELSSTVKDGINATSNVSIKKSNVTISAEDDGIQA